MSGGFANGQAVQLTGISFGTKEFAKPLLYANFENGLSPSSLGLRTDWNVTQNMAASTEGYGGTGGAKAANGNGVWTMGVDSSDPYWTDNGQRFYIFKNVRQNFIITDDSQNWKTWRAWPASTNYPNIYIGASNGRVYVEQSSGSQETGFWASRSATRISTTDWMSQEVIVQASSGVGLKDGSLQMRYDNQVTASGSIMTRPTASPGFMSRNYVVHGVAANTGTWDPDWSDQNRIWVDNVYVDTTWARVVLGDASTYAACHTIAPQPPSAWSESGITVTAQTTAFAPGSQAYVYVFDAAGNVNAAGFAVTVGQTAAPTLTIDDVQVTEGSGGTTSATFTVHLSAPSSQTVTVDVATADGTALAGSDYVAAGSTTLTFAPGVTTQLFDVTINGDTVYENDQNFFVNLSNPNNATILDGQGTGTIINDDTAPTLSIDSVSTAEGGTLTFTVTRTGATEIPIAVDYATADGTAVSVPGGPGTPDFTAASGTLNFAPSLSATATQTFTVTTAGDAVYEATEQFFANLSNASGATISDGQGVGTVADDDTPTPHETWAVSAGQGGATPDDEGRSVAVDASGYVYVTGSLLGAGGGAVTPGDVFVNKYAPDGQLLWSRVIGGTGDDRGIDIAVDSYGGHVYLTGPFQGTVDFDPGPGTAPLTSAGGDDVFVLKLTNEGEYVWAVRVGGAGTEVGLSLALDENNGPVVVGRFSGSVDFDPGAGVASRDSQGGADLFVLKLNFAGIFGWVQTVGGSAADRADAVALDSAGIYVTGSFGGTVDFDPGPDSAVLTSAGGSDAFVLKLGPTGTFLWARKLGGASPDEGKGIAVDAAGAVYVTGWFQGSGDFDPWDGILTLTSAGGYDAYLVALSPAGSLAWARGWGGAGDDRASGVAADASGVYTAGWFAGTVDFDPGTGSFPVSAAGARDLFVSLLDGSGNFVAALSGGGSGEDQGQAVAADASGFVYLTGNFSGSATVDTGEHLVPLSSLGGRDIVVAKLNLRAGSGVQAMSAASWPESGATRYSGRVNGEESGWGWAWILFGADDRQRDRIGTGGQPVSGRQDAGPVLSHRHTEAGNQARSSSTEMLDRLFAQGRRAKGGRFSALIEEECDDALMERDWSLTSFLPAPFRS